MRYGWFSWWWTLFYRYEVYHNCNLTEIGEPFAEQPYALAVQQGSHLQEELSRAILELQKDRRVQCTGLSKKFLLSSVTHVQSGLKGCVLAA